MTHIAAPGPGRHRHRRERWVPVERRFLGLDRRALVPAGLVALLVALALGILPAVDAAVPVHDPVRAGDVVQVGPDVQFSPAAGANLVSGLRRSAGSAGYPNRASVTYEGARFTVTADRYDGTPAQLLDQIRRTDAGLRGNGDPRVTGRAWTILNGSGRRGVAAHVDGAHTRGLVAAFVFGRTGVEIEVLGPATVDVSSAPAITGMIRSVRPAQDGGSA
ncbi:hypothetical protein ACQP1P_17650 [Dactylosporangium sp. CA-052675]|uniref:hypothetical protein n=1 Tax=Dactylosporangium sp. CA-052675 TaxID=3239927 RepID=UPI003D8C6D99